MVFPAVQVDSWRGSRSAATSVRDHTAFCLNTPLSTAVQKAPLSSLVNNVGWLPWCLSIPLGLLGDYPYHSPEAEKPLSSTVSEINQTRTFFPTYKNISYSLMVPRFPCLETRHVGTNFIWWTALKRVLVAFWIIRTAQVGWVEWAAWEVVNFPKLWIFKQMTKDLAMMFGIFRTKGSLKSLLALWLNYKYSSL